MKNIDIKNLDIKPQHIVVAETTEPDYEMDRKILLEMGYDNYIVVEGWHCSCFGFDESEWDAISYTEDEIRKLANADYNKADSFWQQVRVQI